MKHIELLGAGIKLLSVFVFIEAFSNGATTLLYISEGPQGMDSAYQNYQRLSVVFCGLLIVFSFVMWRFPTSIAKWFMPKSADNRYENIDLNVQGLEIVGFSLIGVYILTWAIPDLVHNIGLLNVLDAGLYADEMQLNEVKLNAYVTVLEIAIGIILCLFPGNLTKLLVAMRR